MPHGQIEVIEHTADVALRIRADRLESLFELGAQGLYQTIGQLMGQGEVHAYQISLKAQSLEDLFHDWLGEVLYWFDVRQILFENFTFTVLHPHALEATLKGRKLDVKESKLRTEVKAVTYHNLKIEQSQGEVVATVVMDV